MKKEEFSYKDLMKGIRVVIRNGLQYRKEFVRAIALSLIFAAIDPFDTLIIGRFVDALGHDSAFTIGLWSIQLPLALVISWFILQILEVIIRRFQVLASLKLREFSRTSYIAKVSGHLFRLPLSFHKTSKLGEVQEKITTAAGAMGDILGEDIVLVTPQIFSLFIFLFVIYTLNLYLFLFTLVALSIFIYVTIITVKPTIPLQRQSQKLYAKARGTAIDAIGNIRIVKDFGSEGYQTELIRSRYQEGAMPIWYRLMGLRRQQAFLQQLIIVFSRGVMLCASIYLVHSGLWTIGSFVIANSYLNLIFNPITAISNNWRNIQNGIIAIEDTEIILALPEEKYSMLSTPRELNGEISFDHVSFGYSKDRIVLEDISFSVKPGDIIALVGESGVGKSSLIDLISAYHFPSQGSILIDGTPIQEVPLETLRHNIGVVTQELTLFNDTIRNNIRYGNFDKTDEEIFAAAKKAHCYDFIEKFPEKWEQMVGERGLKLSVGQKQRIAIARAILKNPRILILDEPTSALDAGSEKIITESLDELMKGKTTFVVAHRLSTVRRADKILVFKDGKIIESGTHGELAVIPNGEYRRLYELQIGLHAEPA